MPRARNYLPRIADRELADRLEYAGAVLLEGARGCGKTETGRQAAASEVLLDVDRTAHEALAVDPGLVLKGETPRLIDEWQLAPVLWNHVRRAVDERQAKGQFILTGSAVPPDDATRHSGAGRFSRFRLRPMSLSELGHSNGAISLGALLDGETPAGTSADLSVERLAEILSVGGWPGYLRSSARAAMVANRDYLEDVCRVDLERVDGVRRDPQRVRRFLQAVARNVATCASLATITRDANGPDDYLKPPTASGYLAAFERLMVIEDQPPWVPWLRSRSRLRTSPKRHFVDPSLAVAALGAGPDRLLADFEWFGSPLRVHGDSRPARLRPGCGRGGLPLPRQHRA